MESGRSTSGLGTVVVTGAAGRIGRALRAGLREQASRLIVTDRERIAPQSPMEEVHRLDLRDADAVTAVLAGADSVVHLGGIPDEAPLPDLVSSNILGTHHVLEGARLQGVARVVLASTNRVTGFYPVSETLTPERPPRPDGLYGVSKVALEALGQLYADKFGLSVVALRIGSYEEEPSEPRHLTTWLSPRDCLGFVRAALTAPDVHFATAYAVSANTHRFWDPGAGEALGYTPVDDAEVFAERIAVHAAPDEATDAERELQGGVFTSPDFTLRHLRDGGGRDTPTLRRRPPG
ncbi:NAD(P)-dependent oxidoreductase [Streptomyces sp. N2-109]|uniref:NAD(P)-dependent oxidoreductase n=1 Tax=Streptomyces gossypii TaxID=2883101 RepID=A0ABT2JZE3_9ACTN|nr:NAD(P)-dependent oxidoreductase [Streptomyces gossypii]MCT2593066.1 NAD(P)-dependent oxidoreductase [Streptomyces gossypii]